MTKIIFSKKIKKKESLTQTDLKIIFGAVKNGIFTEIKGENLPKDTKLSKIYITSVVGDRRAVFLMDTLEGTLYFLFFRDKKDKIGKNITIKNEHFRTALRTYLI